MPLRTLGMLINVSAFLVGWFLLGAAAYSAKAWGQAQAPALRPQVDQRHPDAMPKGNVKAGTPEQPDPFKTGVQRIPTSVVLAAGSTVTIADMFCEIVGWSHDTRSVTCGLSGSQPVYSGVLIVHFTDKTVWSRSVRIEQPTNAGVRSVWGVAAIPIYGSKDVASVEFSNGGTLIEWDQTPAARAVLEGTYAFTTPQATYPPAVKVSEMQCHTSEFLVGKSQAAINPTYSVTCMLAGSVPYYGGWLSVWWHQFESRISETNTPAPIPQANSTQVTANHTQAVFVAHDILQDGQQYWAPAAFLIESPVKIAIDRINWYPEREQTTWTPPASTAGYPPQWPNPGDAQYGSAPYQPLAPALPAPPANDYQKSFWVNRWCVPYVSCIRPPG